MSETATAAVRRAIGRRLAGETAAGDRVVDIAEAGLARPYIQFYFAGGGEVNNQTRSDIENLVFNIKCVADDYDVAQRTAAEIADQLNNSGRYDNPATALFEGDYWYIKTVSKESVIDLPELLDKGKRVYHVGASYRFIVERK